MTYIIERSGWSQWYDDGGCWTSNRDAARVFHDGRTQSIRQWARELGVSRQRIHQRLRKYGVTVALSYRHGEKNPALQERRDARRTSRLQACSSLSHDQRRERRRRMAADVADGMPVNAAAIKWGVTNVTVRAAVKEFGK